MVKLVFEAENFKELTDMMIGVEETKEEQKKAPEQERLLDVTIYDSVMFDEKIARAERWLKDHDFDYTIDTRVSGKGNKIDTMLKMEDIVTLRDYIYEGTDHNRAILL